MTHSARWKFDVKRDLSRLGGVKAGRPEGEIRGQLARFTPSSLHAFKPSGLPA
jgi:hypothetical protein